MTQILRSTHMESEYDYSFIPIEPPFRKHWEEEVWRGTRTRVNKLFGKNTVVFDPLRLGEMGVDFPYTLYQVCRQRDFAGLSQLLRSFCYLRELENDFGVGFGFIDNQINQFVLTKLIDSLLAKSETKTVIEMLESEGGPIAKLLAQHDVSISGKNNFLVSESSGNVCQTFARAGLYLYSRLPRMIIDGIRIY